MGLKGNCFAVNYLRLGLAWALRDFGPVIGFRCRR